VIVFFFTELSRKIKFVINFESFFVIMKEIYNFKRKEVLHMLFSPKEKGQGLVEYALILVLVAIVVIAALMILGPIIGNVFSKVNNSLSTV
jgi:pilus assembly protein Flp/PilA